MPSRSRSFAHVAATVAGMLAQWACQTPSVFQCTKNADCVSAGPDGRCEPTNFCSFPDDSCPSGFRYPADGGHDRAGMCAEPEAGTGVADDTSGGSSIGEDSVDADQDAGSTDVSECGNGQLDRDEDCEPGLGTPAQTCGDLGAGTGPLACDEDCFFDFSGCDPCGNGRLDDGEQCDGNSFFETCVSLGQGFNGGYLSCSVDCQSFDTGGCFTCGNGKKEPAEVCDGTQLGGGNCEAIGFSGGALTCADSCDAYDASGCTALVCGFDPSGPAGPCPSECTRCEDDGTCVIECGTADDCQEAALLCPIGRPCTIDCDGIEACRAATITCPPYFACDVLCGSISGCDGAFIECGEAGQCNLRCEGTLACDEFGDPPSVQCGQDTCATVCPDGGVVSVDCGQSCGCESGCLR